MPNKDSRSMKIVAARNEAVFVMLQGQYPLVLQRYSSPSKLVIVFVRNVGKAPRSES